MDSEQDRPLPSESPAGSSVFTAADLVPEMFELSETSSVVRKHKVRKVLLILLPFVIVAVLLFLASLGALRAMQLKTRADQVKDDLRSAVDCVRENNLEGAEYAVFAMDSDLAALNTELDRPLWRTAEKMKRFRTEFAAADVLTECLSSASEQLARPGLDFLKQHPFSSLRTDDGIDLETVSLYSDFVLRNAPLVQELAGRISATELGSLDSDGKIHNAAERATELSDFAGRAVNNLVVPFTVQLVTEPISGLKTEDGFNMLLVADYLAFLKRIVPVAEEYLSEAQTLGIIPEDGEIAEYGAKAEKLLDLYHSVERYIPFLEAIIGDGADRMFAVVAQNSAEIRASGGFPGAVGLLRIQNGILTVGDFSGVHDYFTMYASNDMGITENDRRMFSYDMYLTWDACYCPDFELDGRVWALAVQKHIGEMPDGVISVTTGIIQELLKVFGPVTLDDGMELNGENASRYLQHDIYFEYFNYSTNVDWANYLSDAVFSETARKTIQLATSSLSADNFPQVLETVERCIKNRMIMAWLPDEEGTLSVELAGLTGGLNKDAMLPEAGVYYAGHTSCKLGWYVDILPEMSEPVENPDGSRTYDICVTFINNITYDEASRAHYYITGGYGGNYTAYYHFFAPMGGEISDFEVSSWCRVKEDWYKDLQDMHFETTLSPGGSLTVTYKITTAPGAGDLVFSTTPTLQEYR